MGGKEGGVRGGENENRLPSCVHKAWWREVQTPCWRNGDLQVERSVCWLMVAERGGGGLPYVFLSFALNTNQTSWV